MQPLPKGITGFGAPEDGVLAKKFIEACHTAARHIKGRVRQVLKASDQTPLNFHQALVDLCNETRPVRVVCNAHYPIVAFAAPAAHDGGLPLQFIDRPDLAEELSGEFRVMAAHEACVGVSSEAISLLGDDELNQMKYWKPHRIGDVIFNHWD